YGRDVAESASHFHADALHLRHVSRPGPRTLHHTATHLRLSLNRSPMKRATVTTSWNSWPNNRSVTVKWQCGVVRTQASINGRPRKSCRRILPQSCPPLPLIRHSITPPTTTSAKLTTCNGLLSPAAALGSKIFLPIKNFGAPNSSTPTKNTLPSKHSIRSSEIHRSIFSAS